MSPLQAHIKTPKQPRSEETLSRLLDATETLLEEHGFEAVTVSDIVRTARSSVGSFYARFPNKAALLHALHERYSAESVALAGDALASERWQGASLGTVIDALCRFLVEFQRQNRGLRRALVLAHAHDEEHRRRSSQLAALVVDRVAVLVEERRREHAHPDARLAADFVHRIVFAVLDVELIYEQESPTGRRLDDEALATELSRACRGYLGVRS